MRAMVPYKGRYYAAEQDRRGWGEEAELVIYRGATEIYRKPVPKLRDKDELIRITVRTLEAMEAKR